MNLHLRLLCILGLAAAAPAQSLVANLVTNNTSGQRSSGTEPFHVIGSRAVFVADGAFGLEPYVTDGTAVGTRLLRDLAPDADSSPQFLTARDADDRS